MTGRNQTFYELKERFEETTRRTDKQLCPICYLTKVAVKRYLDVLSYETVNDPQERAKLTAAGGFCNRHAWQWFSLNDALGTALIYQDVAKLVAAKLEQDEFSSQTGVKRSGLRALFGTSDNSSKYEMGAPGLERREDLKLERCPACTVENETEQRTLAEFVAGLTEASFRLAYQNSSGMCLPHVAWALDNINEEAAQQFVSKIEAEKWRELASELDEVVDKFNFNAQQGRREFGPEIHAVRRSIWRAAGLEGMG